MQIRKLDTERPRDVRQFIRFPFDLYRDDPNWVPPLIADMEFTMNRAKHPFYRHSTADFFVAESEGQTLGRIAVADNRNYNRYKGSKVAFFYFFEAVEDATVAQALFDAAFEWARQRGLDTMMGPKGLLHTDGRGLLVEGFEHRPAMGMPYNPPYYERFVEDAGFTKLTDYLSGHIHRGTYDLPDRVYQLVERVKKRRGFRIKDFKDKQEMRQWVGRIRDVYNESFVDVPGFHPITEEEIQVVADRIASLTYPELVKLVMIDDEVVGFLLAYPNICAALQKAKGRLWPFGWFHIWRERKRTKWVDLNGIGLLPKYQGVGANTLLYAEIGNTLRASAFDHGTIIQVSDLNIKSMGDMTALGMEWVIRHRVYQRAL